MKRVQRLSLKPMQKITLLRVYLLPRYVYGLIIVPPATLKLENIDLAIRQATKKILKLPDITCKPFFYARPRDGGLGLPEVRNLVLIAALRNAIKAKNSPDPVCRDSINSERSTKRLTRYAKAIEMKWPMSLEELDIRKRDIKAGYSKKWATISGQGDGAADFRDDKIGNAWLLRKELLTSAQIIDAIKLRLDVFGTRVSLKRCRQLDTNAPANCRKGEPDLETIGHVLGLCESTKVSRLRRHDEIKNLVRDKLAKKMTVIDEPRYTVDGVLHKPDLVVKNGTTGYVVDITVPIENGPSLSNAAKEKIRKYEVLIPLLTRQLDVRNVKVIPIVIGCRGSVPQATKTRLKELGIPDRDALTMSLIALRCSITIIHRFFDTDA